MGGDPRWPTGTIRLWRDLPNRARLEVSSRTNLKLAIWKLLSWSSLRWQQCCLSHGLRLACWTGFWAGRRRCVSLSHVLPSRSPNLNLSPSPNLNPNLSPSLHGIRHGRACVCPIRLSWVNVYRQDIGVTTQGGFVIRRGAGKSSAGAIEVRASSSSRQSASIRHQCSAFGRRVENDTPDVSSSTVRKISAGAVKLSAESVKEIIRANKATVCTSHKLRTVSKRRNSRESNGRAATCQNVSLGGKPTLAAIPVPSKIALAACLQSQEKSAPPLTAMVWPVM